MTPSIWQEQQLPGASCLGPMTPEAVSLLRGAEPADMLLHRAQASSSSGSLSNEGFKGNSEYSRSQLETSAAQKETFFARKMQVRLPAAQHVKAKLGKQTSQVRLGLSKWLLLEADA